MTDTETPIEAGARALRDGRHEAKKRGQDTWEFADMARAVFGSVDVEGLAGEINRHAPSDAPQAPGGTECTCGDGAGAWEDIEVADRHVAEAVKSWLTNGTKEA
jgi:hypothetical protein